MKTTAGTLRTPTARPAFHHQFSPKQAFEWWSKHRYDAHGKKVLDTWSPIQIAQLDAWLGHAMQAMTPGQPTQAAPGQSLPVPSGEGIISRAMSAERQQEGQPVGPAIA